MCLILVAVEKYPFTDQWHFRWSHWKGECETAKAGRPLIFLFHKEPHRLLGTLWSPNQSLESDAPASKGHQDRQLSFLTPSTLITVEGREAWPSFQSGRFQKTTDDPQWNWKVIIFSSFMSKSNRIQRISPWALAPQLSYLLLSSLKTSNSA